MPNRLEALFQRIGTRVKENPIDALAIGFLLAFSLSIRVYRLHDVPLEFMCDEADNLHDALRILYGPGIPLFGYDWKPQPALCAHMLAWWTAVAGSGMATSRMLGVLISTAAVVALYVVGKRLVPRASAAAAASMLACNPWCLNFSRTAWENIHICFYTLCSIYVVYRALETDRWRWYVFAGFWSTLGFLSYFSGRLILLIAVLSILVSIPMEREKWRLRLTGAALLVLAFLVFSAPQLVDMYRHWGAYDRRTDTIAIWNHYNKQAGWMGLVSRVGEQLQDSLFAFFVGKNNSARYAPLHRPLLSPFAVPFMGIGMLVALFRWRRWMVVWIAFLVPWLLTQGLANGAPDGARMIGLLVPAFLFVALGLSVLEPHHYGLGQKRVPLVLIAFCLVVCHGDIREYYRWQANPEGAIRARRPAVSPQTFDAWVSKMIYDFETGQSRSVNIVDWRKNHGRYIEEMTAAGVWLGETDSGVLGGAPTALKPSSSVKRSEAPPTVPKTTSGSGRLRFWKYDNSEWRGVPNTKGYGLPSITENVQGPASFVWFGELFVGADASFEFILTSDDGSYLFLDGALVVNNGGHHAAKTESAEAQLKTGWHAFVVGYNQDDGGSLLKLTVLPPGAGAPIDIPAGNFRTLDDDFPPLPISDIHTLHKTWRDLE